MKANTVFAVTMGKLSKVDTNSAAIAANAEEIAEVREIAEGATAGAPIPKSLASEMVEGGVYLYTGSETGYNAGHVYYYVGGVLQATPVITSTAPLVVTGITVPAGGNAFLVYQARVNEFASPAQGGSVTNTVTVTGTALPAPITASETVTSDSEAFLTIGKSLNPTTVSEGDRLTYTFVIQNFGNTAVVTTDDAVVTDNFDPILSDLAVTFNGAVWAEGVQYTYDDTTGVFATIPANITVPAATYTQNPATGAWSVVPGVSTLVVVGTV